MIAEITLLIILKLKNDVDSGKVKQILFATNMKMISISKNFLKVIIRQLYLLSSVPYNGQSTILKLKIVFNKIFFRRINRIISINN